MEKYIPYEKLSKKEKCKLDAAKRGTWGDLNPVTRKPENSRAYNRKRCRIGGRTFPILHLFISLRTISNGIGLPSFLFVARKCQEIVANNQKNPYRPNSANR